MGKLQHEIVVKREKVGCGQVLAERESERERERERRKP
jgi:hypothetical protein